MGQKTSARLLQQLSLNAFLEKVGKEQARNQRRQAELSLPLPSRAGFCGVIPAESGGHLRQAVGGKTGAGVCLPTSK